MPLHTFTGVERIRVTDEDSPLVGKTGKFVRRVQHTAGCAWVRMDEAIPNELRSFREDDKRGRQNDVVLYADWCEALKE